MLFSEHGPMYARKIKNKNQWNYVVQRCEYFRSSNCRDYSFGQNPRIIPGSSSLTQRYVPSSSLLLGRTYENWRRRSCLRSDLGWRNCSKRFYGSKGDGTNASEDKPVPNKDVSYGDAHARLVEQDQTEWLKNEKISMDNRKEFPFQTRRERFKNEFLRRITPWEKITVSWDNFPYYVQYVLPDILNCSSFR